MLSVLILIFWILTGLLFYTYFGYAILLWCYLRIKTFFVKKKWDPASKKSSLPRLSLIIPAFNEAEHITSKIENCLKLDYPKEKLEIIFVTDGSTDGTVELVREASSRSPIQQVYQPKRTGKAEAINRGVRMANGTDILVLSDANSLLNPQSLKKMVKHFESPVVGGVAGEKKISGITGTAIQEKGEDLYWRYESQLKKIDSDFHSVMGVAGELFSIRGKLYEPIPPETILDDFSISMDLCKKGFRVLYEPEAFAVETPSYSLEEEKKRRTRIGAGCYQALQQHGELLNIFKYGKLSFQFISRRFLRWAICPPALAVVFILNWIILYLDDSRLRIYQYTAVLQLLFYLSALLGWVLSKEKQGKSNLFYIPFYFVFMHLSLWMGFFRWLGQKQPVAWEKSKRFTSV